MLQCPKESLLRLFYNVSSSCLLLFIIIRLASIFLAKLFIFFGGNPFHRRGRDGYEYDTLSDEEIEEECENGYYEPKHTGDENHCPANLIGEDDQGKDVFRKSYETTLIDEECPGESSHDNLEETRYNTPATEFGEDEIVYAEEIIARETDSEATFIPHDPMSDRPKRASLGSNSYHTHNDDTHASRESKIDTQADGFLVFRPQTSHGDKSLLLENKENEIFGDTLTTTGSTSKDSSEWRSSINCTEDPFSSSSRRSCPKWESCTLFQKYDEEMLFLDRISFQKLHETECLRSIKACPRSISERIVQKFRRRPSESRHVVCPYKELESAYVAQICLTWEALNWNYKYFQRVRASRRQSDPGCPAYVAQQFQQFQVLLQRYVENEPYEYGRRPEIYAKMRSIAPKLLQVPEYRDIDDDEREEGQNRSRIPSSSFISIMEESIRTFMRFLKQDKKNKYQILTQLFIMGSNRRGSPHLLLLKKINKKKKAELNRIRRAGICSRRRRPLRDEEELEILMALTDLRVVSRVLKMADLNGEQLHWCENKMNKVRVSDGKLHRDSSPIFYPAH